MTTATPDLEPPPPRSDATAPPPRTARPHLGEPSAGRAGGPRQRQPDGPASPPSTHLPAPRAAEPAEGSQVLALLAVALAHERFEPAAAAMLHALARRLDAGRVSLGCESHGRIRVVAMTGAADFDPAQRAVAFIAAAMDEAVDEAASIAYPPLASAPAGTAIAFAHAELAREDGHGAVASAPVVVAGRVVAALVVQRRDPWDDGALQVLQDAALFVAPLLELKHRHDRLPGSRLMEAWQGRGTRADAGDALPWRRLLLVGVLLAAGLAAWPVTDRVSSPARIEGAASRVLAAPADGFLREVKARPGDAVKAGQPLLVLENRDLMLQRDRWSAEVAQHDKAYHEAMSREDAAAVVMARARLDQARAQLGVVQQQLERTTLRAPFDGVLTTGDLQASVGMPVQRGQELMTVAPDRSMRVVAEVGEEDIARVRPGQAGRALFAGSAQAPVAFEVVRIAPVAAALDGRNAFEVEGRVDGPVELAHGQRGVAKIDLERRSVAVVALHDLAQWLRALLWRVVG